MHDREPTIIKRLLERLLATRARRDREPRYSDAWHAAYTEMHAIERAIFRVPVDVSDDGLDRAPREVREPTLIHAHDRPDRGRYEAERAG